MNKLLSFLNSIQIVLPLISAIIVWFFNEKRKRAWEEYQRKEENYKELIKSLKGFYLSWNDGEKKELKNKFIDQLNLCWLYCPDEVIQKGYNFINTLLENKATDQERENALGELVITIRKDLMKRTISRKTKLKASNFKTLTST